MFDGKQDFLKIICNYSNGIDWNKIYGIVDEIILDICRIIIGQYICEEKVLVIVCSYIVVGYIGKCLCVYVIYFEKYSRKSVKLNCDYNVFQVNVVLYMCISMGYCWWVIKEGIYYFIDGIIFFVFVIFFEMWFQFV